MKRFNCSDSFTPHLLCPPQGEEVNMKEDCGGYSREFQAMLEGLDGEDSIEELQMGGLRDKKRRLSNHQVKSLEKIFEVDNKLDPERKLEVAQDLGLQPRQVAIWFQNRRARWKTKQLERDYNHLKANYDALKVNYHNLQQERETILSQLVELKAKLPEERREINEYDTKEKPLFLGSQNNHNNSKQNYVEPEPKPEQAKTNHENDLYTTILNLDKTRGLLDGLSYSDSSGVLNEDLNGQMINMSPPPSPIFDLSSLSSSNVLPPPFELRSVLGFVIAGCSASSNNL